MYWVLILLVAYQTRNTVEELFNPHLPWRTVLDDQPGSEGLRQCVLPPYPKNGGYVVIDEPNAQPGDRFQRVTLVTYEHLQSIQQVKFKELTCSDGQWRESLFQYGSDTLYFNTSWCPMICPVTVAANVPDPTPPSLTDSYKFISESLSQASNNLCILPPYPDRGSYYVRYLRDPRPGQAYNNFDLVQYKPVEGRDDLYEVKQFNCNAGEWRITSYAANDDKLFFEKIVWCSNLCSKFSPKKSSESLTKHKNKNMENSNRISNQPKCQLPAYPQNGNYTVANRAEAKPGDAYDAARLEYYCLSDHAIIGSESVFCIDGVWSARAPECKPKTAICQLPPQPVNGNYVVLDGANDTNVDLDYTCDTGYVIEGRSQYDCIDGKWPGEVPRCVKACRLPEVPGVTYTCIEKSRYSISCRDFEPEGFEVTPKCDSNDLQPMKCVGGVWNYVPTCSQGLESNLESLTKHKNKNMENSNRIRPKTAVCQLPPQPVNGNYVVLDGANDTNVDLDYTCDSDYVIEGRSQYDCIDGKWPGEVPRCVKACRLPEVPGVTYTCIEKSRYSISCRDFEPEGFEVTPKCDSNDLQPMKCVGGVWNYVPTCSQDLESNLESLTKHKNKNMENSNRIRPKTAVCQLPPQPVNGNYVVLDGANDTNVDLDYTCDSDYVIDGRSQYGCIDGKWPGEVPRCVIECGVENERKGVYSLKNRTRRQTSDAATTEGARRMRQWKRRKGGHASAGRRANINELPWHVGIYNKNFMPYRQICSGSIISAQLVVSAAHCFWSDIEGSLPASRFAVAAGKRFREWNDTKDKGAQFSDVSEIKIPPRFRGGQTNFQDDVALLVLSSPLAYGARVRPVCLDFDLGLDREQLTAGTLGKVAGWGLTSEDGGASPTLQVIEIPSVEIGKCISDASPDFRQYITSDKICAGYTNGTALCKGDSGGGLVVPKTEDEVKRYYLRGIASTAPNNDKLCNTHAVTTFTQILQHEHFIKDYFKGMNA